MEKEKLEKLVSSVRLEPVHPSFIVWAKQNGISLSNMDVTNAWYQCWADGYNTRISEELDG